MKLRRATCVVHPVMTGRIGRAYSNPRLTPTYLFSGNNRSVVSSCLPWLIQQ
jgi:hypothetical protein